MMVIDSSALIALLLGQPEAQSFAQKIAADTRRLLSSVNAMETAIVMEAKKGTAGGREYDLLLYKANIQIIPFTRQHYKAARSAWLVYGKGRHPARLNMGDCCAYALSKQTGESLLFKGHDFAHTDVLRA